METVLVKYAAHDRILRSFRQARPMTPKKQKHTDLSIDIYVLFLKLSNTENRVYSLDTIRALGQT